MQLDVSDAPPTKLGATDVMETVGGTVLVTEAGCVGLAPQLAAAPEAAPAIEPAARVSAAHRIGTDAAWHAPLAATLDELHLQRMRALLEVRPVGSGEWFGDYASAQLAPGTGCTSRPLWLAWMSSALGEAFVVLWAADERAARRAVLALRLGRAAATTHVLLPHALHRQLRRCAYEADNVELLSRACAAKECDAVCDSSDEEATDVEGACSGEERAEAWPASWAAVLPAPLHPDVAAADACDGLVWATLLIRSGEALARLRARRAQAADEDEVAALKKKEEIVSQFRSMDPEAEVDVTHDSRGKYVVNKISFNGHMFVCPVVVNPYSDVKDIVRTATSRCLCC